MNLCGNNSLEKTQKSRPLSPLDGALDLKFNHKRAHILCQHSIFLSRPEANRPQHGFEIPLRGDPNFCACQTLISSH